MSEKKTHKIEQADIITPNIKPGETALVFQRHGKYNRDRSSDSAGSLFEDSARDIKDKDKEWFDKVLSDNGDDVHILFVSSDTQYANKGFRSMETGQLAQHAAVEAMTERGIDPNEGIINFNKNFKTARFAQTDQDIRPVAGIREPDIFNPADKEYITFLQRTYGYADEISKTGLSPKAWAIHEMDREAGIRETTGAEGQQNLIDRTKKSLATLERYSRVWHINNPGKKLVIWATSHYDTLNPLIKEVEGQLYNSDGSFADTYQPVDFGGGIVIKFSKDSLPTLESRIHKNSLVLGHAATRLSATRLDLPRY
ncbi:MAG: hypothetical protein WAQ25_01350 [Candidatus Saccharimonas sp.]